MRLQDTTLERWKAKYGEFRGALKEAHPEFVESLKTGKAKPTSGHGSGGDLIYRLNAKPRGRHVKRTKR